MTHAVPALPAGAFSDPMALHHHRAACGRHIRCALLSAALAFLLAADDPSMICAAIFIACGFFFTCLAVRDQHRADSVFARGVAVALLDGVSLAELQVAA